MFFIVFISTIFIVKGAYADIDENSIYNLRDLYRYESNINDVREIVENLRASIEEENSKLQGDVNSNFLDEIININSEIQELKFFNGFTDVRGPGIMLRVSDSTSEDQSIDIMDKIVHDVDITVLLNDLKNAGAEAIDVNGKRIINISEVVCAGPILKINGEGVPSPFVIRAIGDQDALYSAVNDEGTYAYVLKNQWGMEVTTMMSYDLVMPKFYGDEHEIKYTEIIN
ncbi:uncharacterized protein YlxW (UPF0749 family) [Sedimentibacter acidaminivorans]|jgi:uncharacterized protein YlxW (UPF0749 family)|uniref:Uncharacterized protein YlxW (UPF0749 family) n=1 Tax=Sedimentibacter acidaminivorans TaxID=913099 RepID=A0ABS4G923_9FIRM|nr:DUF881 domain-containing protein [Sedimentibacter acidaminivorans]MBP1924174.1 uncharacterized protein YlxW (UPF0749 family) [Sedimentibacter acidaminivorans]